MYFKIATIKNISLAQIQEAVKDVLSNAALFRTECVCPLNPHVDVLTSNRMGFGGGAFGDD